MQLLTAVIFSFTVLENVLGAAVPTFFRVWEAEYEATVTETSRSCMDNGSTYGYIFTSNQTSYKTETSIDERTCLRHLVNDDSNRIRLRQNQPYVLLMTSEFDWYYANLGQCQQYLKTVYRQGKIENNKYSEVYYSDSECTKISFFDGELGMQLNVTEVASWEDHCKSTNCSDIAAPKPMKKFSSADGLFPGDVLNWMDKLPTNTDSLLARLL